MTKSTKLITTYNVIWKKNEEACTIPNDVKKEVFDEKQHITNEEYEQLINDIEDLLEEQKISETEQLYKEAKSPNIKFNKKNKLSITDLSAQLWCEQQLEFVLTTGKKRTTEAMKLGVERHEVLEKADHEIINVEVNTREESLGYRLLNTIILLEQLFRTNKAREVWVFGIIRNYVFRGVIDELRIEYDNVRRQKFLVISDTKTRQQKKEPSLAQKRTSAIQVQAYCYILQELRDNKANFDQLFKIYECDPLYQFTAIDLLKYNNLKNLSQQLNKLFIQLPIVKEEMEIVYEYNGKEFSRDNIPYFYHSTITTINILLDYWEGKRTSDIVDFDDKWKCKFCDFTKNCIRCPLN